LNNTTETTIDTRKNLLNTTTTTSKDTNDFVANGVKTNAQETGKTYTDSLANMINVVNDKAADLNQSYQDQATDGMKKGRQHVVGLVSSVGETAASYLPTLSGKSEPDAEKE